MAAWIVLMVTAAVAMVAAAPGEDKYTTKYDNVDVDQILNNDRLLLSYFNCIMGQSKCTPDGEELKKYVPEALETDCEKCSERQRKWSDHIIKHLYQKKQHLFKQLQDKFDPERKYTMRHQHLFESQSILTL